MQEIITQILVYVWGAWRFRWAALVLAWAAALGGWVTVWHMPDQFEATARVHVDSNTVLRPLLKGLTIQPDINQRIELMSRTLLSRPNLEKLMRMTDLDLQADTETQKDRLLTNISESIELSGDNLNSSLYSVSYVDEDRDLAKRMVQSLITVFIETTLGGEREDSEDAQSFLDQQISDYESRLIEAESRLASFKQRHMGSLPDDAGTYFDRLGSEKQQLSAAELQLSELENRRDELIRQLSGEEPVFLSGGTTASQGSSLDARIATLQGKLDELLARYTERHPEVIQINHLIEELRAERESEIAAAIAGQDSGYAGLTSSPLYQQMRSMLAETEATIAEVSARVAEYGRRVMELEGMVDRIPEIEAELKQLNRDYEVISNQHSELLERREAARISDDVEQNANDLVFRVIDPPFVPQVPNQPDKLIYNSAVLVIALGAGAGLALLLSLLRPVYFSKQVLSDLTGLPVLGSVMIIMTPLQKRQAKFGGAVYACLLLCLVVAFAGVSVTQQLLA